MLTEDEAKTKVCPIADSAKLRGDNCIASACMAWRWETKILNDDGQTLWDGNRGWCGAVGRP